MKVLLDTCVAGGVRDALQDAGHEVDWVGEWEQDPGDDAILAHAFHEEQVLVTLDKDFGELVFHRRLQHGGIVRLVGFAAAIQGPTCRQILDDYGDELNGGAIVTAEPGRVRVRSPNADESEGT